MFKQKCYKKDLQGLAQYISELEFMVDVYMDFEDNFLKRIDKNKSSYIQDIIESKYGFKPVFSSFYSDEECLIKILIPKSILKLVSQYKTNSTKTYFSIPMNEFFVNITVSKDELESVSLDFREIVDTIEAKINEACHIELKNLVTGRWDEDNSWFITTGYHSCELSISYSC